MAFVLDTSVTVAWCFLDEATPMTIALMDRLNNEIALVPNIWTLEVVNVLLGAQKRNRLTYADIVRFLELLKETNIEIDHETAERSFLEIMNLAHSEDLTSYDAAYLELAMRKGIALATKDKQLQQAASRLGVELLPV